MCIIVLCYVALASPPRHHDKRCAPLFSPHRAPYVPPPPHCFFILHSRSGICASFNWLKIHWLCGDSDRSLITVYILSILSHPLTAIQIRKVSSGTKTKSSEKPPNSPKPNADEFNVPSTFGDGDCAKRQFIARKCVKCKRLPRKPKRSRCCLLLYCEPCSMDTKYQLCSMCGRKQVFKLDSELNNKIPKLTVFCKHNSGGCDWKGKLYKLKDHLLHKCEVPCPYSSFGCQATVTNDNYNNHIEKLALVHLELYKKSRNKSADS